MNWPTLDWRAVQKRAVDWSQKRVAKFSACVALVVAAIPYVVQSFEGSAPVPLAVEPVAIGTPTESSSVAIEAAPVEPAPPELDEPQPADELRERVVVERPWCPNLAALNDDVECAIAAYAETKGDCSIPKHYQPKAPFAIEADQMLAFFCLDLERAGKIAPTFGGVR